MNTDPKFQYAIDAQVCQAAIKFASARRGSKLARQAAIELARTLGNCVNISDDSNDGGICIPCFQTSKLPDNWCDICKQKLPVWKEYRAKANAAGAAMRALLLATHKLEIARSLDAIDRPNR